MHNIVVSKMYRFSIKYLIKLVWNKPKHGITFVVRLFVNMWRVKNRRIDSYLKN